MLIWVWEASLSGDPPPQGTAQQFQKNRDLYFLKKKLNKSPALLIGECYPRPHPHPPFVSLACTPILPQPQGYLQHGTIEAWGALRQGGGAQGRSPQRGPPKTTQHQQEKLQIRQKWGTSFQGPYIQTPQDQQGRGCPGGIRHEPVTGRWASPGAVLEEAFTALSPQSPPHLW